MAAGDTTPPALAISGSPDSSGNLVRNGDFEIRNVTDSALPDEWTRSQSSGETAYLEAHDGGLALHLRNHPSHAQWQSVFQNLVGVRPDTAYTVTFTGRAHSAGGGLVNVVLFDPVTDARTRLQALPFAGGEWRKYQFEFRTPAAMRGEVQLFITADDYQNPAVAIDIDEVVVTPQ